VATPARIRFPVRRGSALVTLGVLSLAACGTTVPLSTTVTAQGPSADQGALSPAGGPQEGGPGSGTAGPAPSFGAIPAAGGGATGGTPPATAGSGVQPGQAGSLAFGVTASTIHVGIPYSANGDALLGALGIKATTGDQRAEAQIVIDEINRRGGIHGRKVVPIYFPIDATADPNTQRQAMCAAFTQDGHAFATLAGIGAEGNETVASCVTKAGGVLVQENISLSDGSVHRRYPGYVTPGDLRLDRAARVRVDGLAKGGYFTPWNPITAGPGTAPVKLGVLTADYPPYRKTVNNVLLPELKAHGQTVDPSNIVYVDLGAQDTGLSALQNAVLRFQRAGVSHVVIIDAGGGAMLFFAQAAKKQQYYPRYGLDSYNAAQLWINTGVLTADDFRGAVGAGWVPMLDLASGENPLDGPNSNAARRRCVALQRAHGQQLADVNAERHAVNLCDSLWLLEAALKAGGPVISRTSFLRGLTTLGTSFVDGQTFSTRFTDDIHDGVASFRHFRIVSACGCFRYSGPLQPIS